MLHTAYTNSSDGTILAYTGDDFTPTVLRPTGEYAATFTWGYQGSGPLETAKAILVHHCTVNDLPAPDHAEIRTYQDATISRLGTDFHLQLHPERG